MTLECRENLEKQAEKSKVFIYLFSGSNRVDIVKGVSSARVRDNI